MDDGPSEIFDSLHMANNAVNAGIKHIFATPHHLNERYKNPKSDILNHTFKFQSLLQHGNIPLTIHPGQEVRIHRDLLLSLEKNEVLTLDDKGQYLLLELPSNYTPDYTQDIVYELLLKGITPIFVHPERNKKLNEDPSLLFELVQEGALTQLTAGSIIGHFGKKIKTFSKRIIEHRLAHFIASDAHNVSSRGFLLQEAYTAITEIYGIHQTLYFKENSELLINGKNICYEEPLRIKKKILGVVTKKSGAWGW